MVDAHVAPSRPEDTGHNGPLTQEQSERGVALLQAVVRRHLPIAPSEPVGAGSGNVGE